MITDSTSQGHQGRYDMTMTFGEGEQLRGVAVAACLMLNYFIHHLKVHCL